MSKSCRNCGTPLNSNAKFCRSCGTQRQPADPPTLAAPPMGAAMKMAANAVFASATAGESHFSHTLAGAGDFSAAIGPFKVLAQGIKGLLRGFGAVLKDKKRLIPMLVLALLWFVLTLLPLLGLNTVPIRLLSFLTFAQGGASGEILGISGGVVGKGIFAYFLMSLVLPLTRGQKPFAGIGDGLKRFFPALAAKNLAQATPLLMGAGAALISYNFMAGASLQNSMAGVVAFLLALRAISNKSGFLRRFLISFFRKKGTNTMLNSTYVNHIMAGWAAGFPLGVLLCALNIGGLIVALGVMILLIAAMFAFISRAKKEVAS